MVVDMASRDNLYSNKLVKKRVDDKTGYDFVTVHPGGYYIGKNNEIISTILGSCIAVCIYDNKKKIAGLNHFLLPEIDEGSKKFIDGKHKAAMRYGDWAMETLLNDMFKLGASRNCLVFKVFGGGEMFKSSLGIGKRNAEFVFKFLKDECYHLESFDVGGDKARKVHFDARTGEVKVKKLSNTNTEEELNYINSVAKYDENDVGQVDFF